MTVTTEELPKILRLVGLYFMPVKNTAFDNVSRT